MKHVKAIIIAASIALLLAGCGKKQDDAKNTETTAQETDEAEAVMVDIPSPKHEPSSSPNQAAIILSDKDFVFPAEQSAATSLPSLQSGLQTTASDSSPNAYIQQMLDASIRGDESGISKYQQMLEALPKPQRGDKSKGRKLNEQALLHIKQNEYGLAAALLADAQRYDPGDIEIASNYGYALLMSKKLDEAKAVLFGVLTRSPGRALTWANLGKVLAIQGDQPQAVAAMLNTYRFSKNPQKTHQNFLKYMETGGEPAVKEALSVVTAKAAGGYKN